MSSIYVSDRRFSYAKQDLGYRATGCVSRLQFTVPQRRKGIWKRSGNNSRACSARAIHRPVIGLLPRPLSGPFSRMARNTGRSMKRWI